MSEIRAGQRGQVRTVLHGAEPETLDLEILGVLPDEICPGVDMILGRLVGENAQWAGVAAGMSGSPVFVEGRLVGALAYMVGQFSKEPIFGVTPIEKMLALKDYPAGATPWSSSAAAQLRPAPLALAAPGVSSRVLDALDDVWKGLGLERPAATLAATAANGSVQPRLAPGDPVSALLVWGDMKIGATGTVTWRDGNQLLAFGHPFLGAGRVTLPLAPADIVWTVPSLMASFKIARIGDPVGALRQDRVTAIAGELGTPPAGLPVNVLVRRPGRPDVTRRYQVARDPYLTPNLAALVLRASVVEGVGAERDEALRMAGRIRLTDGHEIQLSAASAPAPQTRDQQLGMALAQRVAVVVRAPVALPEIEAIDLTIAAIEPDAVWSVTGAMPDRLAIRPGESVRLIVALKGSRGGERRELLQLATPAGLQPGSYQILVGAESTLAGELGSLDEARRRTARTASDYLAAIASEPADDRLEAVLVRSAEGVVSSGYEYPALPGAEHLLMRTRPGGAELYRARLMPLADVAAQLDRTILEAARVSIDVLPPESSR